MEFSRNSKRSGQAPLREAIADGGAEALPGSVKQSYQLVPGDCILRAIPLQAGHHELRMVYAPGAWPAGVTVSAVAWLTRLGGFFIWLRPPPAAVRKERRK